MAVSVRMDPTLEQELDSAAKRQGITKSQFIVDAVERALGRKDPYRLLLKVQEQFSLGTGAPVLMARAAPRVPYQSATLQDKLRAKQDEAMVDWLAYQEARKLGQTWQPDAPKARAVAKKAPKAAPRKRAKP